MTAKAYAALSRIQRSISVPKNRVNKFGGYNFRNCEDILIAIKAILQDGEVVTLTDDVVFIQGRFYVKATAAFCSNGECVTATGWSREADTKRGFAEDQITGSASSYARKYALNALFMIDDAADSDEVNDHGKGDKPKPEQKPEQKPEPKPENMAERETYSLIAKALKSAKDFKTLNQIWTLRKVDIEKLPEAGRTALEGIYQDQLDKLNTVGAG